MSEYWKSTPKYWCKHCKTYIRDTKLEKTNHEATPKHQGNLKRFLRDLHRGHEKDEKDKERAKSEVARLNGLVTGDGGSGSGFNASSTSSPFGRGPTPSIPRPQATAAQRKQQLAQLAEMGVSIPDEFRPDMAMAGEWQVTEQRIIGEDEKPLDAKASGVRKRAVELEDEEEAEAKKRKWGSTHRSHPTEDDDADLDALLGNITGKGKIPVTKLEVKDEVKVETKDEPEPLNALEQTAPGPSDDLEEGKIAIKRELSDDLPTETSDMLPGTAVKEEVELKEPEVVFKKRKAKNIRQR